MREPRFGDDEARRAGYGGERAHRWTLEEALREPVMDLMCAEIRRICGQTAFFAQYAQTLIDDFRVAYPQLEVPGLVRGAPDFKLIVNKEEWYVELKIKKTRFLNTVQGTQRFERYGCESHYLDDDPVYINTLAHSLEAHLPLERVLFVYAVNPNASVTMDLPLQAEQWQFECISLQSVQANVGQRRYQIIDGGYGRAAYLVRCDDMEGLTIFSR